MPTKAELADQLNEEQLRDLARRHNVDISQTAGKNELAAAVAENVSQEDLEAATETEHEGPDSPKSADRADSLDPMLVDPEKVVRERAEGRTSDAASRSEDARAAGTQPDLNEGVKPSDAGPEQYPFPAQGDVEVATVDSGDGDGEFHRPLEVEDWVVLGEHELIPDRLAGRRAVVLDAPREPFNEGMKDDYWITVRTRDDVNATLNIPLSAVADVERGGRSPLVRG